MTTYFFKAVASDGKVRTGTFPAENDKAVAKELRRQGLIPVYVGLEKKKSFELKLPSLSVASSCVKNNTSLRLAALRDGSLSSKDFFFSSPT